MVLPRMVYISDATELGTCLLYTSGYLTAVGKVWQLTAIDAGERVLGLGLSLLLLRFVPQMEYN